KVALLDVLAVVAFVAGHAEETLLQNRIPPVPERERKADLLVAVADPRQSILVPTIDSGPRMVMRKILPGRAVRAVVFAHSAPGALAHVRSPPVPVRPPVARILQPLLFARHSEFSIPHVVGWPSPEFP